MNWKWKYKRKGRKEWWRLRRLWADHNSWRLNMKNVFLKRTIGIPLWSTCSSEKIQYSSVKRSISVSTLFETRMETFLFFKIISLTIGKYLWTFFSNCENVFIRMRTTIGVIENLEWQVPADIPQKMNANKYFDCFFHSSFNDLN